MVIVVRYWGATLLRSLMKKTKAAPIAMYPTKKRKKVTSSKVAPSAVTNSGRPSAPIGFVSTALTVEAIARAKVAIKSRLVVLENLSVIMFLNRITTPFYL